MKKVLFPIGSFFTGLLFLWAGLTASAFAESTDMDAYKVEKVPAEAKGASGKEAQEKAFQTALREGMQMLLERLVSGAETPEIEDSLQYLLTHQVHVDKQTSHFFKGHFTFQFDPTAVSTLLQDKGLQQASLSKSPLIIVPILDKTYPPLVFEEESPWFDAWYNHKLPFSTHPLIVPEGDGQDLITSQKLIDPVARNEGIEDLLKRYPGKKVALITQRTIDEKTSLIFEIYNQKTQKLYEHTLATSGTDGDLVKQAVSHLNVYAKRGAAASEYPKAFTTKVPKQFAVKVYFDEISHITHLMGGLSSSDQKTPRLTLKHMSSNYAEYELQHQRDLSALRDFFLGHGFRLQKSEEGWEARPIAVQETPRAMTSMEAHDPEEETAPTAFQVEEDLAMEEKVSPKPPMHAKAPLTSSAYLKAQTPIHPPRHRSLRERFQAEESLDSFEEVAHAEPGQATHTSQEALL